ncbi:MAG TPA: hypothetical protein PLK82_07350 [Bacteroidales bacterium]|nr:hypothetical protein [Bacteroidales bacterium]
MNYTIKTIAILALVATVLTSCKKENTTSTPAPTPTGNFTFKVDGTAVTVDSARAVLYTLGVSPFNREIDVYGFKAGQQVIEMHFHPTAGTYPAGKNFDGVWMTYDEGLDFYDSESGSLVLTTCDTVSNKIEGTFHFTGKNFSGTATRNITEGSLMVTKLSRQ